MTDTQTFLALMTEDLNVFYRDSSVQYASSSSSKAYLLWNRSRTPEFRLHVSKPVVRDWAATGKTREMKWIWSTCEVIQIDDIQHEYSVYN